MIPAEWWTIVEITSSTPYVVPVDRYFVITQVSGGHINDVLADGEQTFLVPVMSDMHSTRVAFPPGTVLSQPTVASTRNVRFYGYLQPID